MSYATPNDIIARYDFRTLGDLVGDDGSRKNVAELQVNTNLQAALDDASGLLESACFVGSRYTHDDLNGLTGNSLALIKRLTCDFAFAFLRQRRGYDLEQFPLVNESFHYLDRLRLGERVFDVGEVEEAGNASSTVTPKWVILEQHLLRDNTRYFPVRRWTSQQ